MDNTTIIKKLESLEANASVLELSASRLRKEAARIRKALQPVSTGGNQTNEVLSDEQKNRLLLNYRKNQLHNATPIN